MNKKAFTYIETLISVALFAVLVSIFIVSYKIFTNYNERSEVKNIVQIIKKARVSAIMQGININVSISNDEINVSNIDETRIIYKLKYVKIVGTRTYQFTSEGGTMAFKDLYDFLLESKSTKKRYKVIIAAVGGQVRYEEL